MRRLVQPGWLILQAAIFCGMMWVFQEAKNQGEHLGGAPVVISLFFAWGTTVVILILAEGVKDIARYLRGEPMLVRQKPIALPAREPAAGRLASPRNLARLEALGRGLRGAPRSQD